MRRKPPRKLEKVIDNRGTCNWPGCQTQIIPALWACAYHWFLLPDDIQQDLWSNYRKEYHRDRTTTLRFQEIEKRAINWIMKNHGPVKELAEILKDA